MSPADALLLGFAETCARQRTDLGRFLMLCEGIWRGKSLKPGWTCKGDGKHEHGRVHVCGTAEAITPPLTQPGGCAFTCAAESLETTDKK